jgi:hypothetical protein
VLAVMTTASDFTLTITDISQAASSIHRTVEQHAVVRGALPAVTDVARTLTYRELNYAANTVARHLMAHGFRRGAHATVRMRRGTSLAVVLLAVLKAGGSYTWSDPERTPADGDEGVWFSLPGHGGDEASHADLSGILSGPIGYSPNLPVVTRGSDVACILREGDPPSSGVLVPHATILALRTRAVPQPTPWIGEAGAFDLWMALIVGTTAIVESEAAAVVAA